MKITKEDIGRKVWCKENGEGTIYAVTEDGANLVYVGFPTADTAAYLTDGRKFLSDEEPSLTFEQPKTKKRDYQWKLNENGRWYKPNVYISEDGYYTDGVKFREDWYELEKIKCEDDYIEV